MGGSMNVEFLRECFTYDAATGALTWCRRPRGHFKNGAGWHNFNKKCAGKIAGTRKPDGRIEVGLGERTLKAARIVWALHTNTGVFGVLDHIDGNPNNDKIENLREVTTAQNTRNRTHTSANSSGIRGVTWHTPSKKWWVRVTLDGKTYSFGLYHSLDQAAQIAYAAKHQLFGEFARHA